MLRAFFCSPGRARTYNPSVNRRKLVQCTNACISIIVRCTSFCLNLVLNLIPVFFDLFAFVFLPVIADRVVYLQDHFSIRMAHPPAAGVYIHAVVPAERTKRMTERIRHDVKINPCRQGAGFFFCSLFSCFPVPAFFDPVDGCFHAEHVRIPIMCAMLIV